MAQVPATSKLQRVLRRLSAAVLGPRRTAAMFNLQTSEIAALEHRANPHRIPVVDPDVVFLVPLVGRSHVDDWTQVEARLAATVASFRNQSSPRWIAVICGQDRPDTITFDEQVRFLPFDTQVEGNDKWAKLDRLCRALPDTGIVSGYAMPFDADDLLHPDAVLEINRRRETGGYLVTRGLIRNAQSGETGQCAPQSLRHPGRKAFWKMCGSCAVFRFDFNADTADADFLADVTAHEHRMFPYLAALAARPLRPLQRDAVLYIVNHGENFGARRGRVSFKSGYISRFLISDPEKLAQIEVDFPGA